MYIITHAGGWPPSSVERQIWSGGSAHAAGGHGRGGLVAHGALGFAAGSNLGFEWITMYASLIRCQQWLRVHGKRLVLVIRCDGFNHLCALRG